PSAAPSMRPVISAPPARIAETRPATGASTPLPATMTATPGASRKAAPCASRSTVRTTTWVAGRCGVRFPLGTLLAAEATPARSPATTKAPATLRRTRGDTGDPDDIRGLRVKEVVHRLGRLAVLDAVLLVVETLGVAIGRDREEAEIDVC